IRCMAYPAAYADGTVPVRQPAIQDRSFGLLYQLVSIRTGAWRTSAVCRAESASVPIPNSSRGTPEAGGAERDRLAVEDGDGEPPGAADDGASDGTDDGALDASDAGAAAGADSRVKATTVMTAATTSTVPSTVTRRRRRRTLGTLLNRLTGDDD